ncbi:MAG: DUF4835 family protein [Bacteroidales bacterium]|nr:DUF4835 family protein [Bacteroidales bacterium]
MQLKRLLGLFFIIVPTFLTAQELKCNVQINSQKIQGTNRTVYQTLQTAIYEFMNNTSWTNHVYNIDERIECNIVINLNEQIGSDEYKGTIQVQARRPVFNTSYNTTMLNFLDNYFDFRYLEFNKLEFNENTHLNNLTSVLAFYAYIILGIDYDSYSYMGGTEYFQKAEKILNNAQNAPESGWKVYEGNRKNRYWMIENILDEKYRPIREVYYRYHRLGLDLMNEKLIEGRVEIVECTATIQKVFRDKPDPYLFYMQLFFDAKNDELVNLFSESYPAEKTRVLNILTEIDNANASKYKAIMEQKN